MSKKKKSTKKKKNEVQSSRKWKHSGSVQVPLNGTLLSWL